MPGNVIPISEAGSGVRYLDAGAAHARFYAEWRNLEAFTTLTPLQRCILQDALMEFTKAAGNTVRLTCKGITRKYHVGHKTARAAIAGLEERGWIDRIGLSPGPTGQAGGNYELMCIAPNGGRIAGPYSTWRAPRSAKRDRGPA